MIIPVIFVGLVFLVIFAIAGIKGTNQEGGEDMIKNVYIYLVLFVTLMMTIGGSVGVFMSTADMVSPEPYYQTFDDYVNRQINRFDETEIELSDEELRENYENVVRDHKDRERIKAQNSLIKSLAWIVVPLPIFIFFQRRLQKKN
ncbi:hypothetical protein CDO51_00780 [Natranaerobius trueperi]|uniref:DUF5671 domain-containing protein n=1 Tax=Natranaerobius trueperi TaxID=759412 RepID=A0A226C3K7_9FIRM|nr:hypothetical protein CDO51_00780 [Natranaerobius trueperi]